VFRSGVDAAAGLDGVDLLFETLGLSPDDGQETASVESFGSLSAGDVRQRRGHVDVFAHGVGRRAGFHHARPAYDEARLQAFVVTGPLAERERITLFAGEDEDGVFVKPVFAEQGVHRAHLAVQHVDLREVVAELAARFGRVDEVAGQAAVNTAMAQATFNEGKAFLQTYKAQALQAYANDPNGFQPYYCVGAYNVTRSTNGYASFLGTVSSYAGGTEQAQYTSHTYAMSSGRECALSELVSDSQADLQALWKASFTALIEADEDAFYSDAESRLARSLNQVQFYLTDSGIVFYLSPGIIAPAATGAVSFEIAYQI
jgi:hypothetical protein